MGESISRTRQIAELFKALGDPSRLRIFEFLCSCASGSLALQESGEVRPVKGLTVGEVCCRINGEEKVTSTISQQLKQLRHAGLITVERRGKNMICSVNQDSLDVLAAFAAECKCSSAAECCCE